MIVNWVDDYELGCYISRINGDDFDYVSGAHDFIDVHVIIDMMVMAIQMRMSMTMFVLMGMIMSMHQATMMMYLHVVMYDQMMRIVKWAISTMIMSILMITRMWIYL